MDKDNEGQERFDWSKGGPKEIACGKCRSKWTVPTRAFRFGLTGTVDHLYLCESCKWGTTIRYVPAQPRFYVKVAVHTPGKRVWDYILPRKKGKKK